MFKVSKPEHTFRMTVSPVYTVFGCQEKRDDEAHGLMGFHRYASCPACRLRFDGWEVWGENGHRQAAPKTRQQLLHYLKIKAREQTRVSGRDYYQPKGSRLGFRFERGSAIYYRGN